MALKGRAIPDARNAAIARLIIRTAPLPLLTAWPAPPVLHVHIRQETIILLLGATQ